MCGICGIVNGSGRPVDEAVLLRMRDAIAHRGPDDAGHHLDGPVGLGMRRLSIIDLQTGHQPIFNEDGTICVVFNGEIYNYRELRDDLWKRGHRFQTQTDTEVIVHLYEDEGPEFLQQLNGMFGLALWDSRKNELLLARDRLGIKPLYTANVGDVFLFGSELKALLQHPAVSREVDPAAISEFLTYEYIPAPRTAFAQIEKIPPASYVVWKDGRTEQHTYWDVSFEPEPGLADETACAEAIRERLQEAVRLQLRSDVPLGVLLSGGMDSSSVVAMMHRLGVPIDTFSIGFDEPAYNELDAATLVANTFGTNHHFLNLSASDVKRLLPTIIGYLDEPLADASIIPTYLVCHLARQHVKVVLSGDGGDETFGGYETYKAHKIARYYRLLPRILREGIRRAVPLLPASKSHMGFSFKAQKFTSGVQYPPAAANALWWGAYTPEQKIQLIGDRLQNGNGRGAEPFEAVSRVESRFRGGDLLDRIFYCDLKLYLQDDLLVKVDRMSMANSLEVRVPFLDHHMVEFATGIPSRLKVNGLKLKYILRKAMAPLLPESIITRPKRGFDIPLDAWLRGPLKEFVLDTLSESRVRESGFVNPAFLRRILTEHMQARRNHRQLLWPLVILEYWRQRYA